MLVRTLLLAPLLAAACSASPTDDERRNGEIVGGVRASDHEEAALVNMQDAYGNTFAACSGAVIAPRVVLTAGHCVDGVARFQVVVPYATGGKKTLKGSKKAALDWIDVSGDAVDPSLHDVGLIILDAPIVLAKWPTIAKTKLGAGGKAVNIGRIGDGVFSSTDLFVGKPIALGDGAAAGYPYDYVSSEIIQSGDSGGPVEKAGTREIVAVNSGAGSGTEVLARVDLVWSFIDETVAANGGWPTDPGDAGPDSGPKPSPDGDGDGVADAQDLCSKTPAGAPVWTEGPWIGCAEGQHRDGGGGVDGDGDGVPDGKDRCAHTPPGAPVWPYGEWIGCAAGEHRDP